MAWGTAESYQLDNHGNVSGRKEGYGERKGQMGETRSSYGCPSEVCLLLYMGQTLAY